MELIDEVKAYLDITWDDSATNIKLQGMIERAKKRLIELSGNDDLNFDIEDSPKELLLNRVRYERSGALDEFESDYKQEIIFLQNREKVKRSIVNDTEQT